MKLHSNAIMKVGAHLIKLSEVVWIAVIVAPGVCMPLKMHFVHDNVKGHKPGCSCSHILSYWIQCIFFKMASIVVAQSIYKRVNVTAWLKYTTDMKGNSVVDN